jgi:hypothetical protein
MSFLNGLHRKAISYQSVDREIDVARGVNDIELVAFPEAGGGGGLLGSSEESVRKIVTE